MTTDPKLLERVRKEALQSGLADAIKSRLFSARKALENASYEDLKDFGKWIETARRQIDETEILHREWYNL